MLGSVRVVIFFPEMEFADRHVAGYKRYGIGEIGEGFLFVGLDVDDHAMPSPRGIRDAAIGRIGDKPQDERFYTRGFG